MSATISTREKIIKASVDLFNKRGISPVTLRDIADKVGISSGNLAYHFKNKDYIIAEIFRLMEMERQKRLSEVQQTPSFDNADRQTLALLNISLKYRFFFLDTVDILRAHPKIGILYRRQVEDNIRYIRALLDYSVEKGNITAEPFKGCYDRLSESVWAAVQFWLLKETIRGHKKFDPEEARISMWTLVRPYLTKKGINHFPLTDLKKSHANHKK
jgi:AcrR family transcriptional regulator